MPQAILLQDVEQLGERGQVIDVSKGYLRNFLIPRLNETGPSIDVSKPAKLRKKIDFRGATDTFRAINTAKSQHVILAGGVSLTVGEGATAVTTRFGSDAEVKPDDVEAFIDLARQALANPLADVVLRVEDFHFINGRDLETFASRLGLDIEAGEVEQ